jgi:hypothetical protein
VLQNAIALLQQTLCAGPFRFVEIEHGPTKVGTPWVLLEGGAAEDAADPRQVARYK